jgi:hypothetical protein
MLRRQGGVKKLFMHNTHNRTEINDCMRVPKIRLITNI